jgi:hypothetical protein
VTAALGPGWVENSSDTSRLRGARSGAGRDDRGVRILWP